MPEISRADRFLVMKIDYDEWRLILMNEDWFWVMIFEKFIFFYEFARKYLFKFKSFYRTLVLLECRNLRKDKKRLLVATETLPGILWIYNYVKYQPLIEFISNQQNNIHKTFSRRIHLKIRIQKTKISEKKLTHS